jgi:hypothetical protein
LAGLEVVPFADLADEPFLALPRSSGGLRDYWLRWPSGAVGRR